MGRALNHNSWCCTSFLILAQTQIFDRTLKFQFASPLCLWSGSYTSILYEAVTRVKAIKDCGVFTNTMLRALETPARTEEVWRKLGLNPKRPQLMNRFVLSSSSHRNNWLKAVAGLNIVEALVILGQPKLEVVGHLAIGKQERPKFWYGNKKVCSVERMEMSQGDLMRRWGLLGRYLNQFWEVKQGSALQVFCKNSLSAGWGLPLSIANLGFVWKHFRNVEGWWNNNLMTLIFCAISYKNNSWAKLISCNLNKCLSRISR